MITLRSFEFPQTLVFIAPYKKSKGQLRRDIKKFDETILGLIPDFDLFCEECFKPVVLRIQELIHFSGWNSPTEYKSVLHGLKQGCSEKLRPCRLSTVIRILISDFDFRELPVKVHNADFCLPILDEDVIFRIAFWNKKKVTIEKRENIDRVNAETPIMFEEV